MHVLQHRCKLLHLCCRGCLLALQGVQQLPHLILHLRQDAVVFEFWALPSGKLAGRLQCPSTPGNSDHSSPLLIRPTHPFNPLQQSSLRCRQPCLNLLWLQLFDQADNALILPAALLTCFTLALAFSALALA